MTGDLDLFGDTQAHPQALQIRHGSAKAVDEWLTPPELVTAVGPFDLDPCAPRDRPWDTATRHYSVTDDGLRQRWVGRVWLNPPYADTARWLARLRDHPGGGLALLFARTETGIWFDHVWPYAAGLLFLRGRLTFHHSNGQRARINAGTPSVLVAYSDRDAEALARRPVPGAFVEVPADG